LKTSKRAAEKRAVDIPAGTEAFTLHKRSGFADLLWIVALASLLEIAPVHLIAHHWSAAASWIATALGLYGAFWCIDAARSLTLQPTLVGPDEALIRLGKLFTLRVPADSIAHIGAASRPGVRVVPRGSEPNVCLEFKEPLTTELIFGIRRPLSAIALVADDPEALTAALRRMAY